MCFSTDSAVHTNTDIVLKTSNYNIIIINNNNTYYYNNKHIYELCCSDPSYHKMAVQACT